MEDKNKQYLLRLVQELKLAYYEQFQGTSTYTVTWADTAFKRLKKLLNSRGFTLGVNTIREIFTGRYEITSSTQKINTLNTLSHFLGYDSWADFTSRVDVIQKDEDDFLNIIIEFNTKLWEAYRKLPEVYTKEFQKYLIQDSSFKEALTNKFLQNSDFNLYLDESSTYRIYRATVKWITVKKACIQTTEQWFLDFNCESTTRHLVKIKGKHKYHSKNYIYLFVNKGGLWKIGDKYNIENSTYEKAERIIQIQDVETGETELAYPFWHEEFQQKYFDVDDEDFDLDYKDVKE